MTRDTKKEPTHVYLECGRCGHRWAAFALPMGLERLGEEAERALCPNCAERRKLFLCPTDGPGAVIDPRRGRRVRRKNGGAQ